MLLLLISLGVCSFDAVWKTVCSMLLYRQAQTLILPRMHRGAGKHLHFSWRKFLFWNINDFLLFKHLVLGFLCLFIPLCLKTVKGVGLMWVLFIKIPIETQYANKFRLQTTWGHYIWCTFKANKLAKNKTAIKQPRTRTNNSKRRLQFYEQAILNRWVLSFD